MKHFKLNIIVVAVILCIYCININAQDTVQTKTKYPFNIGLATGVTTFALNDVNELFEDIIEVYRQVGFPVKIQRQNPGNILFQISASKDLNDNSTIGLRLQHTWTSSYALYSDAIGDLDFISRINVSRLDGYYQLNLTERDQDFQVSLQFIAGLLAFDYNLTTESKVPLVPELNEQSKFYFNKVIPSFELLVFTKYNIGVVGITGAAGFRIASTSKVYATSSLNGEKFDQGEIELDVTLSGLILSLGMELAI